jgi:hypothetical protein
MGKEATMANIKSKFNEAVAYFANIGLGKAKIKFQPVPKGKTFATRECHHCNSKWAVVFQGFEDKSKYMLWCPKCSRLSFPEPKNDSAYEGKGLAEEHLNKSRPKCQGTTKKGKPCKNNAMKGSKYCGPHQRKEPGF